MQTACYWQLCFSDRFTGARNPARLSTTIQSRRNRCAPFNSYVTALFDDLRDWRDAVRPMDSAITPRRDDFDRRIVLAPSGVRPVSASRARPGGARRGHRAGRRTTGAADSLGGRKRPPPRPPCDAACHAKFALCHRLGFSSYFGLKQISRFRQRRAAPH